MVEAIVSPLGLLCIGVATILFYTAYRFLVSPYRVLSRHGIKGPAPLPIVGNYLTISKKGYIPFLEEQCREFGSVFGFYVGSYPRIAIADINLAKEIMVKDTFTDRGYSGYSELLPRALGLAKSLVPSTGEAWKRGRYTLTPSFSGMKMKLMVPLIKRSSDVLVEKLGEFAEYDKCVEVQKVYGLFTLETLIATAFGRYVDLQRGEADQLTEAAAEFFRATLEESSFSPDALLVLLSNFPWLEPLVLIAIKKSKSAHAVLLLMKTAVGLINNRLQSQQPPKVKDLLQLMIDSMDEEDSYKANAQELSNTQLAAFSVEFLLAGYETTAIVLSYTSYLLAMNTDVQEKLQAEIDNYFEEDPEASLYEAAQKIKYLEMVIYESMRLYTPVSKTKRYCSKTVTIDNVTIPEGADVVIPIDLIHHNSEYWPDPYKFDPERFTPEAKAGSPQLAHMPFGWGPRNCIGLRFALLETKIALMEILKKFSFAQGPETVTNLQQTHGITSGPKGGVMIKIVARE